jgi:thiamine-phosphate pyrophosphorylase
MLDDVSPAVERALEAARLRAGDAGLDAVHVFLALIEDDEGRAAQVLIEAGGELAAVRQRLEAHPSVPFDLPSVMTGAREVAGERAENTVTGEFLLLGLVRAIERFHEPLRQAGVRTERFNVAAELPPIAVTETIDFRDTTDYVAASRLVDANANRAREALRVLDDYCRFALNDGVLTEEVKSLRHRLVELLERIPASHLNESRDSQGDVGTSLTAVGEMLRVSTLDVARVNCKRLQESLRSLEEYGKLISVELAHGIEALRYRSYTLERAIGIGSDSRNTLAGVQLQVLLSGSQCAAALDWTIREAAAGGATMFQLREKTMCDRDLLDRARNVRRWTREVGALFIVNDRPDIARLVEADGVHLGQDDMSVADARKVLGPGPLIGVSTHTPEQVRQAVVDGANFIGVGPTFASKTKGFEKLAGVEFVRQATAITSLPAFVIGGVTADNIHEVVAAGGRRVAVSAAICQADEPQAIAARLRAALGA